ncbi:unnamed protein product [Didymodactylos carnosus]|uniref:Isochorismatase-like domain-containing protein n=1 Tax=Didymodactylos carnosus TaxID=1234261 RepID=A0A8S2FE05_9BILA|nr:unnamed protein product [Didymodactylos carnosus]CAF4236372.1 unnamed protein product [Didymodactylos carnosus]
MTSIHENGECVNRVYDGVCSDYKIRLDLDSHRLRIEAKNTELYRGDLENKRCEILSDGFLQTSEQLFELLKDLLEHNCEVREEKYIKTLQTQFYHENVQLNIDITILFGQTTSRQWNLSLNLRKVQLDAPKAQLKGQNLRVMIDVLPYTFVFHPNHTALISIDMQREFIESKGFGAAILGNDVSYVRQVLPNVASLLEWARELGLTVIHTREAHLPDLSDCPMTKRKRGRTRMSIGDVGPMGRILVRGEPGQAIMSDVAPLPNEYVIDKPGKGAFYKTNLAKLLEEKEINRLIVCGVTTDGCVQATLREANDRGYECLLIENATASYAPEFKQTTLEMLHSQGENVCWTAPFSSLPRYQKELE